MTLKNLSKKQMISLKTKIEKEWCERSYYKFFIKAFKILEPEEEFVDNWHVEYLCNVLQKQIERIARKEQKEFDIAINIPPRSLKTYIVTICLNAWAWIHYPHLKFITSSYSADLAIEHAIKTRDLIQSNWYQDNWSDRFTLKEDRNTVKQFDNDRGGKRIATSVGGTVTGKGADIIIADDPIKPDEASSETVRKSTIRWWTKTMFSRLNDQSIGLRLVIMQRLHEEDLTGYLISQEANYKHICIPAELTNDVKPKGLIKYYENGLFFPKRFTYSVLEEAKKTQGSAEYAGQYLQTPSPADGEIIKKFWFKTFYLQDVPHNLVRDFYTDGAYGKEGSDNSATICYSVHNGNLYIWSVWIANLPLPKFLKSIVNFLWDNYYTDQSIYRIEPKASGISMVQMLKELRLPSEHFINVTEDIPPTDSKLSRVKAATPFIESGRVYLYADQAWIEPFIHECITYPNGIKDDQVDTLAAIIRLCQSNVTSPEKVYTSKGISYPKGY